MSLAAGVGAKKTLGGVLPEWVVVLTGSVLVAFAAFCLAAAVWRELYLGTPPPPPDVRRLPRALLFALNGFLEASGARRAVRRLVWPHRRELTTAIGPEAASEVATNDRRNGRYWRRSGRPPARPPHRWKLVKEPPDSRSVWLIPCELRGGT
jgi:hypothetical protein